MYVQLSGATMLLLLLPLLMASSSLGEQLDAGNPVVNTSLGYIEGSLMKSFDNRTIYAFRGIRYAVPPVGHLRFEPAKPLEPWAPLTYKATSDSLICPQTGVTVFMSEDCLKLNVFSTNLNATQPVIIYIHGGANVLGSGHSLYEAGPAYLMDHDVVLVAFNYRLGALGFLNGGNFGYLDQVLVLEWVQMHIHNFGGDPDNVTLMGLSAGSMAVSLHLASPLSKGLFHRAIMMSGSATNHFSIDNHFWTRLLARQLACPMYNTFDVAECLRGIKWQRIMEICSDWEQYKFVNMKWNYQVDGYFLPEHPTKLIAKGRFNRVPLLVTFTANEWDYAGLPHLENDLLLHDINVNFNEYAPELYLFDYDVWKSRRIKAFYLGSNVTELNDTNIESFGRIFSDAIIGHGVHRLVQVARKYTNVYYGFMNYTGKRSLTAPPTEGNVASGVGHADDLQYVMPGLWYGTEFSPNHSDVFMMRRMTKWFTDFAKTGKPTNETMFWPPCNATKQQMLYNEVDIKIGPLAYTQRYRLWDRLFPYAKRNGANRTGQGFSQIVISIVGMAITMLSSLN